MSGSSSDTPPAPRVESPQGSGGSGGGSGANPCATLMATTILNSPKAAVLAHLQPGQVLDVGLRAGSPGVVVATWKGQEAGSITFATIATLINCLNAGFSFVADVLSVNGGRCEVRVRPESRK